MENPTTYPCEHGPLDGRTYDGTAWLQGFEVPLLPGLGERWRYARTERPDGVVMVGRRVL